MKTVVEFTDGVTPIKILQNLLDPVLLPQHRSDFQTRQHISVLLLLFCTKLTQFSLQVGTVPLCLNLMKIKEKKLI